MERERVAINYRLLGKDRIFPEQDLGRFGKEAVQPFDELIFVELIVKKVCGAENCSQAYGILKEDPEKKKEAHQRFINELCDIHELRPQEELIMGALRDADGLIERIEDPRFGILGILREEIGVRNEIGAIKDPLDLLLLTFSPKADPALRYEARRKLVLMDLALELAHFREITEDAMDDFLHFLNTHIWEGNLGVAQRLRIVADHSPIDNSCQRVTFIHPSQAEHFRNISTYQRTVTFQMRPWGFIDDQGLVYVEHRLKDTTSLLLKMLARGTDDPLRFDDLLGLKFVLKDRDEIDRFTRYLQEKSQGRLVFQSPDPKYDIGKESKLEMIKIDCKFDGYPFELQFFTIQSYLDSRFKDGIGVEEYSLRKLLDSSAVEYLYPPDIYGIDLRDFREVLIRHVREKARLSATALPRVVPGQQDSEEYTVSNLDHDIARIDEMIYEAGNFIPDYILVIGDAGGFTKLQNAWPGAVVRRFYPEGGRKPPKFPSGKNVLIIVDRVHDDYDYQSLKNSYPNSRMAAFIKALDAPSDLIDYWGKIEETPQQHKFYWEDLELGKEKVINVVFLPYCFDDEGRLLILAQEEKFGGFKLIGGQVEEGDKSLNAALLRELREETMATINMSLRQDIGDYAFEYIVKSRNQPSLKGFVRAVAYPVRNRDSFRLGTKDANVLGFVWVRPEDIAQGLKWESYRRLVPIWVQKISDLTKNIL